MLLHERCCATVPACAGVEGRRAHPRHPKPPIPASDPQGTYMPPWQQLILPLCGGGLMCRCHGSHRVALHPRGGEGGDSAGPRTPTTLRSSAVGVRGARPPKKKTPWPCAPPPPPRTKPLPDPPPSKGKESLWLLGAPFRNIVLQMHTPARTSQCWSRQTPHGLGVCIWMPLVNGTGSSPSPADG